MASWCPAAWQAPTLVGADPAAFLTATEAAAGQAEAVPEEGHTAAGAGAGPGTATAARWQERVSGAGRGAQPCGWGAAKVGTAITMGFPCRRAKLLLKKKRYREQLLDRTENQISSLEAMVQSIEFTQIEMKVMEGLQVGNECLNKMHQVMSIEEVERILDETQEAVEYQRQIDELLAGSFTQEDEDAILEELDAITQEQFELPEVPTEPLPESNPEKAPVKTRPRQAELVAAS
uniref:Charged multivesicular body protein 6 n=1 Tax=Castor canadensis TaxID=51338 RepID=A0A8C0WCK5_CASCN